MRSLSSRQSFWIRFRFECFEKVVIKFIEMQPSVPKFTIKLNREQNDVKAKTHQDCKIGEPIDINAPSFDGERERNLDRPAQGTSFGEKKDNCLDDDHQDCDNAQNQIVVYNPAAAAAAASDDIGSHSSPTYSLQNQAYKISPNVGAFTVQCSICFKWRLLPSKKKYEEIREHILEQPFVCEAAREWRPEISCDDEPDIRQDGSRLWAIDRPNIAQPPLGWERLLRIRGFGGSRFADVYYITPSGKKLRSTVEIQRYLLEHPGEAEGVDLSRFSFQTPKPLRKNFVKKGTDHVASPDGSVNGTLKSFQASPLAWTRPEANAELQLSMVNYTAPYNFPVVEPTDCPAAPCHSPSFKAIDRPTKRSKQQSGQMYNGG
ncbi:methyl-CpG-binding domain-containing protein 2 [Heracleum sosnowskyi]|uniref:Methyl-CpG-binding domain-containing protein 2 n=1 Tax=Heracleum sosnowskyi TaxID=360622 RepID=A0AAD8LYX2_9APIA|nr:methyl-CpG-binding domain-containing protein 2 [Heracleum sosnowskyi]